MLSMGIPFFEYWVWLLVPALIVYHWQNSKAGLKGWSIMGTLCMAGIALVLSAIMLAGVILPLLWLTTLLVFTRRLFHSDKLVRTSSRWVLLAFFFSAVFGWSRMKLQGEDFMLGRFIAGGPGQSYFSQMAKREPFPADHLASLYGTGSQKQANNVLRIFEARLGNLSDPDTVQRELRLLGQMKGQRNTEAVSKVIAQYQQVLQKLNPAPVSAPTPTSR
jgi:hypothetical protein